MKEEWKSVLMRHGAPFVAISLQGDGILLKQILSVSILGTQQLVREFIIIILKPYYHLVFGVYAFSLFNI